MMGDRWEFLLNRITHLGLRLTCGLICIDKHYDALV
jgi:hypothetical protein